MVKRPKAQDIVNQSNFVFGEKVTFAEAFPELDDWKIEVEETDTGVNVRSKKTYEKPDAPGEFVNCTQDLCVNGGVRVGFTLHEMIRKRETEKEFSEICQGYWGSPKGRKKYRPCPSLFRVKIWLKYKSE